ncbi:hypothetical protein GCM10009836_72310 [Pseudonocardia ailaonensis]|uniref:Glyceraldehyde 3-phosphate dehydrogenase NAD(P) binding domain-containing protein n=1 Tax=Pseudonocardia ailaonensis TaxID=367279 RepID=A0ABN2NPU2_9PSEU
MRVRVGVDGMGRLGRHLLRTVVDRDDPDVEIVAVRDAAPAAELAALLRHDSTHGSWSRRLEVVDEHLGIGEVTVRVLHDAPARWAAADVEVLVSTEATVEPEVLLG